MTLNEYLKHLRIEKGIKLREFAKIINYSHGHVSRIENGKTTFNKDFLSKFIKAVSNNKNEFNLIQKTIQDEYGIEVEDIDFVAHTTERKKPVSLNNMVGQEFEIDGVVLTNEEMRFIISMARSYREFKRGI